jgi:hypothetical protein
MLDEHVIFFEASGIEEDRESLAGSQAAFRMLRRNTFLTAAEPGEFAPFFQFLDGCGHVIPSWLRAFRRRPSTARRTRSIVGQPTSAMHNGQFLLIGDKPLELRRLAARWTDKSFLSETIQERPRNDYPRRGAS